MPVKEPRRRAQLVDAGRRAARRARAHARCRRRRAIGEDNAAPARASSRRRRHGAGGDAAADRRPLHSGCRRRTRAWSPPPSPSRGRLLNEERARLFSAKTQSAASLLGFSTTAPEEMPSCSSRSYTAAHSMIRSPKSREPAERPRYGSRAPAREVLRARRLVRSPPVAPPTRGGARTRPQRGAAVARYGVSSAAAPWSLECRSAPAR